MIVVFEVCLHFYHKVILKTAHSFRFRINDAGRQVGVRVSIDTVRKEWMQVMCTLDCLSY